MPLRFPARLPMTLMAPLAVGLFACAVHAGTIGHGFTFDDHYLVTGSPLVTGPGRLGEIFTTHYWAPEDARGGLYRPVTVATFRLNALVFGMAPWSFHLVNVLLHGVVAGLLVRLLLRLTGSLDVAAAGGLLFAAHPIHSETVASVVGRGDLLAAMFVLGAWLARRHPASMAVLFALGLLSKESAVVLPGLLLIEDLARGRPRGVVRTYLPPAAVVLCWLLVRQLVLGPAASPPGPFAGVDATTRILTAIDVLGRYVRLWFLAAGQSADYSYDQVPLVTTPLDRGFLAGALAAGALGVAFLLARRRAPAVAAGVAIFVVALAPVSNVFFGINVVMAERLLYLPSMGLSLAAAEASRRVVMRVLVDRRLARSLPWAGRAGLPVVCLAAALPAAVLAGLAWRQSAIWRDDLTLFEATVQASPRSAMARLGLGSAYHEAGRLEEAEAEYRRAVAIDPRHAGHRHSLATLLAETGRTSEAIEEYHAVLRIEPAHDGTLLNLGLLHQRLGRLEEAEVWLRKAIEARPRRSVTHYALATVLEAAGRSVEAIERYREASRLDPADHRILNDLGRALLAAGQVEEAIAVLERALEMEPGGVNLSVNLGAAWLRRGDAARAARLARQVLATHPREPAALRLLEAAEATGEREARP